MLSQSIAHNDLLKEMSDDVGGAEVLLVGAQLLTRQRGGAGSGGRGWELAGAQGQQ